MSVVSLEIDMDDTREPVDALFAALQRFASEESELTREILASGLTCNVIVSHTTTASNVSNARSRFVQSYRDGETAGRVRAG